MPVTVAIRSGGEQGEPSPSITLDAPMVVLGRGDGCDVRLPDPSVSHRHATIRQRGSEYIVQDEGSTNGTSIGGVRLGAHAPRILKHGDQVRLGRVYVEIRLDAPVATSQASQATKEIALGLVARALAAQGEQAGPRLIVVEGPDDGKMLALDETGRAYVLGRGREVDFVLDDADASRRHVQVVRRGDVLVARDLGSKNGALLEASTLPRDRDVAWRAGERLWVGSNVIAYEHPAIEALAELERAADEKLREGEVPPPPPSPVPASSRTTTPSVEDDAQGQGAREPAGSAPIAEVPRGAAATKATRRSSGWTGTDFVVVLLAIGVLALSAVGLAWLFRS